MDPEKKRDYFFYLSLVNLFWVGMNCPDLSQGGFFLCTIIMLFWFDHTGPDKIPTIVTGFLIAYLFFHYIPLLMFGFIKTFKFIKEPIFLLACYKYGHFLGKSRMKNWPGGIIYVLLAMVSGFAVFSFLSIYMAPNVSLYAEQTIGGAKAGRTGIMIWTGKPGGFGPILGVQANMGSAFLPVIIFGALNELFKKKKEYLLIAGVCAAFILLGLYTNVLLKNRGPFVILAGLIMVIGMYNIIFGPKRLTPAKLTRKIIVVLSVIIISLIMIRFMPTMDLSHLGVVARFTEEGNSSPRTEFWKNCIRIIGENPLGGRKDFFGHTYAHNIWLDVGYDSGVIAMFFLIIFHCIHFKDMADLIFKKLPIHQGVISGMIAMFFIIFISLFTEPIGKGYTIYYAMTFFYCGLLKRLKTDGIILKKELYLNEINHRLRNAGRLQA
jgi:O-Antigen ligase